MIFDAFQRESADNVFSLVRNVSGTALSAGAAVCYEGGAAADGVRVTVPATAIFPLFAGIVAEPTADSAFGKVQKHGFRAAGAFVASSTDVAGTAGNILIPVNATTYMAYSSQNTSASIQALGVGQVFAAATYATATTTVIALRPVFIKSL